MTSSLGRRLIYGIGGVLTRLAEKNWGATTGGVRRLYLTAHLIGKRLLDGRELNALGSLAAPGMIVCDIGANVGATTAVLSRRVGPTGRVLAFEPDPFNAAVLRCHMERRSLSNVTLFEIALGDRPGRRHLRVNRNNRADSRILPRGVAPASEVSVPTDTVDALLQREGIGRVDLVKIDVQGFEPFVLRGMAGTLTANPGIQLVVEFYPEGLAEQGEDALSFLATLIDRFAEVEYWEGSGWIPLPQAGLAHWLESFGPGGYTDLRCHS